MSSPHILRYGLGCEPINSPHDLPIGPPPAIWRFECRSHETLMAFLDVPGLNPLVAGCSDVAPPHLGVRGYVYGRRIYDYDKDDDNRLFVYWYRPAYRNLRVSMCRRRAELPAEAVTNHNPFTPFETVALVHRRRHQAHDYDSRCVGCTLYGSFIPLGVDYLLGTVDYKMSERLTDGDPDAWEMVANEPTTPDMKIVVDSAYQLLTSLVTKRAVQAFQI